MKRFTYRDRIGLHFIDSCYTCGGFLKEEKLKAHIAELEDKIESGLLLELPCRVGDTVYQIVKFCEKCIPERYREEYKPFTKFDNDCEYYEASFYESAERCKEREECDSERENCSLDLNIYCEKCKQRLAIQKDLFTLGKLKQVYGTKQYNFNTPLEDTYFLSKEQAAARLKELQEK